MKTPGRRHENTLHENAVLLLKVRIVAIMGNAYRRMLYAMVSTIAGISLMKEIVVRYILLLLDGFIILLLTLNMFYRCCQKKKTFFLARWNANLQRKSVYPYVRMSVKVVGLQPATLLKRRLRYRFFPVNLAKIFNRISPSDFF